MQRRQEQQKDTSSQITLYSSTHTTNWDYEHNYFSKNTTTTQVPLSIFSGAQAPLQALVTYLRDIECLSFKEMAQLLNRAESTLRVTHANAKNTPLTFLEHDVLYIPADVFSGVLSVLEVVVVRLHQAGLRNIDVASFLNKDPRTTSTILRRAKKKGVMHDDA